MIKHRSPHFRTWAIVLLALWTLTTPASSVSDSDSDASRRSLHFKVGVYDPQGASETSRNRPSRKPVKWQGDMIDLSKPSPSPPPPRPPPPPPPRPSPPPPVPVPSPPPADNPSPVPIPDPWQQDDIPNGNGNLLARGSMCSAQRIKDEKSLAGNFVGNNYYEPCDYRVSGPKECCNMCQNNAQCTGFVYERADCSGRGGPTDVGVCLQLRDSVVSWPAPESTIGSLNPFAQ